MLARVQRGLESLYRVDTGVAVDEFVIDAAARDQLIRSRRPREQLIAVETEGEMNLALYIDRAALDNLERHDPSHALGNHNLGDFLLAVEGVSHFIYAVMCARSERPLTQMELELQAEVDKYVTCLLLGEPARAASEQIRTRLFGECEYEPDLDAEEAERYRAANDNAHRYAAYLESEFLDRRRIPDMLSELRRFYREGLAGKLSRIARAA